MQTIASRISLVVAGALLLACAIALVTVQKTEKCRPSDCPTPSTPRVAMAGSPKPTLAPPQEVIRVQVETDRSDIEVSWAE